MDKRFLFLFFVGAMLVFVFLNSYILVNDGLYFNNFAEQLSYEQIEDMLAKGRKWEWLSYVLIPVIYITKLAMVAGCLSIGALFLNNRFEFKKMWGIALMAEFVFIVPIILKIFWFAFIQTNYTLKDLQLFYPLSLLNFFDTNNIEPWLLYPLQVFNVFEVAYWLLLARGIQPPPPPKGELSMVSEMTFGAALQLVLVSYGSGLLVWVALVMFLTLSYS